VERPGFRTTVCVVVSAALYVASLYGAMLLAGAVVLLGAMAHGGPTPALTTWVIFLATLATGSAISFGVMRGLELWALAGRPPATRKKPLRIATAATALAIIVFGPLLAREYDFWSTVRRAHQGDLDEHYNAIHELSSRGGRRAFRAIRGFALESLPPCDPAGKPEDGRCARRRNAIHALANFEQEGKPLLLKLTAAEDPEIRGEAAAAIVRFYLDPPVAARIVALLETDPDASVRLRIVRGLRFSVSLPWDEIVAVLDARLRDEDPAVRCTAAFMLAGDWHDRRGMPTLFELIRDETVPADVRLEAIRKVGRMRGSGVVPLLGAIEAGGDEIRVPAGWEERFHRAAAEALRER